MSTWLWGGVLLLAVWTAHWGAEHLAEPLKKLRQQWGLTEVAGAAFVGLAAASPEIGINTASAFRNVADIGLGTMLGSNIIAIPLVVTVAYWASRTSNLDRPISEGEPQHGDHAQHRRDHLLRVERDAVRVQAVPYLVLIGLVALLTLPAGWRGLQPLDGWIMLAAYLAYAGQAIFRGRKEGEQVEWTTKGIGLAVAGVVALAVGAYFTVRATENLVQAFGIPKIVGGLFITAPMAALPELFAVRSVTRSGQVTAAITSVIGDHAVTMTIAFLPLAFVGVRVQNVLLYGVNIAFVALVPAVYAALIHWGSPEHGFKRWQVLALDGVIIIWIAVMVFEVLNIV